MLKILCLVRESKHKIAEILGKITDFDCVPEFVEPSTFSPSLFSPENFDLAFVEIPHSENFPGNKYDGEELLKNLRSTNSETPLLTIVNELDLALETRFLSSGSSDCLSANNLTIDEMRTAIHRLLAMKKFTSNKQSRELSLELEDRAFIIQRMVSTLGHEIGTQLGVIRGRAELMSYQYRNDEKLKKSNDLIIDQVDRITQIIQNYLNLGRTESESQSTTADIQTTLKQILDHFSPHFKEYEISCNLKHSGMDGVTFKHEIKNLVFVLNHLIQNAIYSFTRTASGERRNHRQIWVTLESKQNQIKIIIQDNGMGMAQDQLKSIYSPFTSHWKGTNSKGLGLFTCFRMIQSWGGNIQVSSIHKKGTTVTLVIPNGAV